MKKINNKEFNIANISQGQNSKSNLSVKLTTFITPNNSIFLTW
jgi:hypothetical protein